jgi:hypothetical protein
VRAIQVRLDAPSVVASLGGRLATAGPTQHTCVVCVAGRKTCANSTRRSQRETASRKDAVGLGGAFTESTCITPVTNVIRRVIPTRGRIAHTARACATRARTAGVHRQKVQKRNATTASKWAARARTADVYRHTPRSDASTARPCATIVRTMSLLLSAGLKTPTLRLRVQGHGDYAPGLVRGMLAPVGAFKPTLQIRTSWLAKPEAHSLPFWRQL